MLRTIDLSFSRDVGTQPAELSCRTVAEKVRSFQSYLSVDGIMRSDCAASGRPSIQSTPCNRRRIAMQRSSTSCKLHANICWASSTSAFSCSTFRTMSSDIVLSNLGYCKAGLLATTLLTSQLVGPAHAGLFDLCSFGVLQTRILVFRRLEALFSRSWS